MGPLARAVLVAVLLDPAFLLTQHDRPTVETTPSINLQFDPRRMTLTWDCMENITAITCRMMSKEVGTLKVQLREKMCQCSFRDSVLHGGATLTVTVNISQRQITEKLLYVNPGGNNTAAQNFSCFIYNADFMNCTWAKGREAPDDVQYFLYIRDSKKKPERQCRHYVTEAGTHVGCHLDFVSELRHQIYILVNGSSETAGIQFFDDILLLKKIEMHSPPSNISVGCNASQCLIRWERPRSHLSTSDRDFQYQLDIQRQNKEQQGDKQLVELSGDSGNKYNFHSPQPRARHTVRMRAADSRWHQWGAWSPPAEFGRGEHTASLQSPPHQEVLRPGHIQLAPARSPVRIQGTSKGGLFPPTETSLELGTTQAPGFLPPTFITWQAFRDFALTPIWSFRSLQSRSPWKF